MPSLPESLQERYNLYLRAADFLTTRYIQSGLDWDQYQLALAALRAAFEPELNEVEQQRSA